MGDFGEESPANLGQPTFETDPIAQLFSASYAFGEQIYNIENTPGPSAPTAGSTIAPEEPPDVTTPAETIPTGAAMGGPVLPTGDSKWILWPTTTTHLLVSLPNGLDVRSIWFPVVGALISIAPGSASGSVLYVVESDGAELVPIPFGLKSIALSMAAAPTVPFWVFVSGASWGPSKGGTGTSLTPQPPPVAKPVTALLPIAQFGFGQGDASSASVLPFPAPPTPGNVMVAIACAFEQFITGPNAGWVSHGTYLGYDGGVFWPIVVASKFVTADDAKSTTIQPWTLNVYGYFWAAWEINGANLVLPVASVNAQNAGVVNPLVDIPFVTAGPVLVLSLVTQDRRGSVVDSGDWTLDEYGQLLGNFGRDIAPIFSHKMFNAGATVEHTTTFDAPSTAATFTVQVLIAPQTTSQALN